MLSCVGSTSGSKRFRIAPEPESPENGRASRHGLRLRHEGDVGAVGQNGERLLHIWYGHEPVMCRLHSGGELHEKTSHTIPDERGPLRCSPTRPRPEDAKRLNDKVAPTITNVKSQFLRTGASRPSPPVVTARRCAGCVPSHGPAGISYRMTEGLAGPAMCRGTCPAMPLLTRQYIARSRAFTTPFRS